MIRRTVTMIAQKKGLTILNSLVLIVLSSFVLFGFMIYDSAKMLQTTTVKQLGITINITGNAAYLDAMNGQYFEENNDFPSQVQESLDKILALENVVGIETLNASSMFYALPQNFENSKIFTGVNIYEQSYPNVAQSQSSVELFSNAVNIVGCSNIALFDYFRRNLSKLSVGEYPNAENPGAIISMELAEQNNIGVGDFIELSVISNVFDEASRNSTVQHIKITGLYETDLYFDIGEKNDAGIEIFKNSPCNTIFTDYDTAILCNEMSKDIRFFAIYLDSYDSIDTVLLQLQEIEIDWDKYEPVVAAQSYYADIINQTNTFVFRTAIIVVISIFVGICLFYLYISSLNISADTSILFILGETKGKIICSKCLEHLIYMMISLPISLFFSYFLAMVLRTTLTPKVQSLGIQMISYSIGSDRYIPDMQIRITALHIIMLCGYFVILLFVLAAVVLRGIRFVKLQSCEQ